MAMLAGDAGVNGLADEIYNALNDKFPLVGEPAVDDDRKTWCNVIAQVVISHIQTNATVATTVAVTSVGGVTTGIGVSGPGAGTGTGTIT